MIYSQFVNAVADILILLETIVDPTSATPSSDVNFNTILPRAIEYAEQRMYRELDLLQTGVSLTAAASLNVRAVTIPAGMIVINSVNVISPSGVVSSDPTAKRNALIRVSQEGLNFFWPQGQVSVAGCLPRWYANFDNSTVYLAPTPDAAYSVEFVGTVRPAPLTAVNTSTLLTTYIPDVFVACAMVFFSGYQRDFGAQSDNPQMAQSWESQYQMLKTSAVEEIARMKSQGQQWRSFSDTTKATSTARGQ